MLISFHPHSARQFPWRAEHDPYKIGLAEIVLQKTRASSALPVYSCLVKEFPTPSALSAAALKRLEQILRPIGLSSKRAAQLNRYGSILSHHGVGALANWRFSLAKLSGLGAYGARAVACFGFNDQIGLVDSNIARILRRIFKLRQNDPRAVIFQRYSDELAICSGDAKALNYSMLDLGAAFCTSTPKCGACPLRPCCAHAKTHWARQLHEIKHRSTST